jgi:hypothetical protein
VGSFDLLNLDFCERLMRESNAMAFWTELVERRGIFAAYWGKAPRRCLPRIHARTRKRAQAHSDRDCRLQVSERLPRTDTLSSLPA